MRINKKYSKYVILSYHVEWVISRIGVLNNPSDWYGERAISDILYFID